MSNYQGNSTPPQVDDCLLDFSIPHILVVTINRPQRMNSIPYALHWQLDALWSFLDDEESLRVGIITGAGTKAFCAGSDLIEIEKVNAEKQSATQSTSSRAKGHPNSGFAGLSRRAGRKPIIAAVNGFALGGGMEIVLNW